MMKLSDREWAVFQLTGEQGLFSIKSTKTGIDENILIDDYDTSIPYITRTETNNGIKKFISKNNFDKFGKDQGNCITIGLDTQSVFYQPSDFITGQNIQVLQSDKLNYYSYQFIVTILRKQIKSKFNWGGNGATLGRLNRLNVLLPITPDGQPDYQFMTDYIRELFNSKRKHYYNFVKHTCDRIKYEDMSNINELKSHQWGSFRLENIFECKKGIYLPFKSVVPGDIPFITAKSSNNGVKGFIGNKILFLGNKITIEKVHLTAYYQPIPFYCSHDVSVIYNNHINKYNAQFIVNCIKRNGLKYSYGRQAQLNVVKREIIMLPSTSEGEPDYEYMEQYIKKLVYRKYTQYLDYIQNQIDI